MRDWEKSFNAYERKGANITYIKNICNTMEEWAKNMDAESKQPIDVNMLNVREEKEIK